MRWACRALRVKCGGPAGVCCGGPAGVWCGGPAGVWCNGPAGRVVWRRAHLVHLLVSRGGEGVDLIEEEERGAERLATRKERRELLLSLPVPLGDERLGERARAG
eukprot:5813307-Prymnesium_polylepis.1